MNKLKEGNHSTIKRQSEPNHVGRASVLSYRACSAQLRPAESSVFTLLSSACGCWSWKSRVSRLSQLGVAVGALTLLFSVSVLIQLEGVVVHGTFLFCCRLSIASFQRRSIAVCLSWATSFLIYLVSCMRESTHSETGLGFWAQVT